MRVLLLGLMLLNSALFALDKTEFIQHFEGKYLTLTGGEMPVCLKVKAGSVRAVNKRNVCLPLARASIRQSGEVCIKTIKASMPARCEIAVLTDNNQTVMQDSGLHVLAFDSKQALLQALGDSRLVDHQPGY